MLLQARGQDILRVKGFLNVGGEAPCSSTASSTLCTHPCISTQWPDDDRRSRLVFIGRGLDADALRASLGASIAPLARTHVSAAVVASAGATGASQYERGMPRTCWPR